jgi:hypothetical protein
MGAGRRIKIVGAEQDTHKLPGAAATDKTEGGFLMKTALLGGAALFGAFLALAATHPIADKQSFQAILTGSSEVPPVATSAEGRAEFTLNGDTVTYSITAKGLMRVVAAHIHVGATGQNGGGRSPWRRR